MIKGKPRGYWTKENCRKEALKYNGRYEFFKASRGAYKSSLRNGWLDDICDHMVELRKPIGHWDIKENCRKEALKYNGRNKFQKESRGAYTSSRRKGWLDELCSHMVELRKPIGHWDIKENCRKEALKYKIRIEFQKESGGAYQSSRRNGWLDDVCDHMEVVGNLKMRGIYVFEFEDKSAYVGLTYNFKKRYNTHINSIKSSVYKHIEETNLTPKFIQLTEYMDEELASKEETMWVNKYISNGWDMLNIRNTGGLGGGILKWDYDSCKKEALKYKGRYEFKEGNCGAYESSRRNGWLDDICSHMLSYGWTKENCNKESLKYKTRIEFQKGSKNAYQSSRRNGWLDDVCGHMEILRKPNGHWDIKENCRKEALKYKTRTEFRKGTSRAYGSSRKNGWLDEVCTHMGDKTKPKGYWGIKENCLQESLKYKNRGEFKKGTRGAYNSSWKNGWLDEFFPKTKKV